MYLTKIPFPAQARVRQPSRNHQNKRNLWPWRDWMTIGIGVLASEPSDAKVKPSHLVLLADTMGSFGVEYSHPRLHKMFAFPETDLYATAAGDVSQAALLMPMISATLAQTPERSCGDILRGIIQTLFMFKTEKFNLMVLPKYGLPPASIAPTATIHPSSLIAAMALAPPEIREKLEKEWYEFTLGCDLIIGAIDKTGQAMLVYLYGDEDVIRNGSFPGYCAIGSGSLNAMFWLSHRAHVLGMGLKRATYHAYEAKLMAEGSAHVNEHLDMIVATKGKYWDLTTHKLSKHTDCPVNFAMLKEWYGEFGPKNTDKLDKAAEVSASA
jgi:hypothetical protein